LLVLVPIYAFPYLIHTMQGHGDYSISIHNSILYIALSGSFNIEQAENLQRDILSFVPQTQHDLSLCINFQQWDTPAQEAAKSLHGLLHTLPLGKFTTVLYIIKDSKLHRFFRILHLYPESNETQIIFVFSIQEADRLLKSKGFSLDPDLLPKVPDTQT
jgi:hypothetical protein